MELPLPNNDMLFVDVKVCGTPWVCLQSNSRLMPPEVRGDRMLPCVQECCHQCNLPVHLLGMQTLFMCIVKARDWE
jgi:hypothetical protein